VAGVIHMGVVLCAVSGMCGGCGVVYVAAMNATIHRLVLQRLMGDDRLRCAMLARVACMRVGLLLMFMNAMTRMLIHAEPFGFFV
jgi:hypothetical protein